jgi:hypothetical protein
VSYQANVLKVMIASPGDVQAERDIATEEIYRWNDAQAAARSLILQPVKWETHGSPEMGAHPQEILNENLLRDSDIVVGIFGNRIGTATKEYISGTVEEIKRHVAAGKLAMLYFSQVPVALNCVDFEQYEALTAFKKECQDLGLYGEFETREKFREHFGRHLTIELNKPRYVWQRVETDTISPVTPSSLSDDAKRLLIETSKDRHGMILTIMTHDGFGLQTNDKTFTDGSSRSAARWKAALRELVDKSLVDNSEESPEITDRGYAVADELLEKIRISDDAMEILQAGEAQGQIMSRKAIGMNAIHAGDKMFPQENTPKEIARWEAAFDEIIRRGFVTKRSDSLYSYTKAGFDFLESSRS